MAELQVGQTVWILVRLPGVVLDHETEKAPDPYSGTRIVLAASREEVITALRRGVVKRSRIITDEPKGTQWQSRPDLSISQKVLADFTFQFEIIGLPTNPSDPEALIAIAATDFNLQRMLTLRRAGESMPGQRVHRPPQTAQS
ncbi:MAG: hypothetical protein CEN92_135 [Candidatus Berkelbacteria bacterium Licking1014_96]|uniref:Uncharacterized protein n=1 Tax=Candidatus Berkelbacteria bacterium Licking1014_96 TaxID=2017149 RepID=A0A554LGW8_9BACT|nr:MAG: hypothetical protein CEN92_135 [Candidatus Berkelbacteria bacterium Licking1014_96]